MMRNGQQRFASRRGFVLVVALACLLAAGLVGATMLRTVAASHRQMQRSDDLNQAVWLAESGLQRARWKLAKDASYEGETWTISATEFNGRWSGVVTIAILPVDESPSFRRIDVRSRYPDHVSRSIMHRIELKIKLPQDGDNS